MKPHVLCVPVPAHGHINAMLKLAKLLHFKGFHITFVNPEFQGFKYLVHDEGSDSWNFQPGFNFETISDSGISNTEYPSVNAALLGSIASNGLGLIRNLITKLNSSSNDPPVSCIVWDCIMPCLPDFEKDFDIPQVVFWSMSAAVLMIYLHTDRIKQKARLHQENNEDFMNMNIDFIPGLRDLRMKDVPSYFWDGNELLQNLIVTQVEKTLKASAIILHTFDALESEVLQDIKPLLPPIYTIGPLNLLERQLPNADLRSFKANIIEENHKCLDWLNSQKPDSVVYVSFGSTTEITREQLTEFAWGLANCKQPFLWIIRTDLVTGDDATLPSDFIEDVADRSMICSWCPQEKVLHHPSTAVFLTHCGWNSIVVTMSAGVPVINWPFSCDQQTNCWSTCVQWEMGMEIGRNVRRDDVKRVIGEVMEGVKGKEIKEKAMVWKRKAEAAIEEGGSSCESIEKVIIELLTQNNLP